MHTTELQDRFITHRERSLPAYPVLLACAYVASCGIAFHFQFDIPLLVLSACGVSTACSRGGLRQGLSASPLFSSLCLYLLILGASILFSSDVARSIRLTAPLLPALLLFIFVAEHFVNLDDIGLLYLTFAALALGLSAMLLGAFRMSDVPDPSVWVSSVGSPLLVVKNDVTFLAVVAPMSLAVIYLKPRSLLGLVALTSLVTSVLVIGLFQSRGAFCTMVFSVYLFFVFIKPRFGVAGGVLISCVVLLIDGLLGFPLIGRFIHDWDGAGRIPLWISAWKMFLDAPLLGQGPHTYVTTYGSYLHALTLPSWMSVDPRTVPWPHNLYLEVLAEQGILGFAAFMFLLIKGFSAAVRLRTVATVEVRVLGYGALASLAGFSFAAFFELTFLRQWVPLALFTILGVIAHLSYHTQNKGGKS